MGIIQSKIEAKIKSVDENEVDRLSRDLSEIDSLMVQYLNDSSNTPCPDFERLIARIQTLPERKDYAKSLSLKITNLKHKAYYYHRSWQQIRENILQAAKNDKKI